MLASSVLRGARSIATPALSCVRYRHPETRPSDTTIDLTPDQKLVQRPLKRPPGRLSNVTIGQYVFTADHFININIL